MKFRILASVLFVMLITPARADTCLDLMFKIDKALETAQVSSEKKQQAQELRDQGEIQRQTGGDCETPLLQALQLLGE
jgi:hypothetical protein